MNIDYITTTDFRQIYDYCRTLSERIPYWFDADYELWLESFMSDTDYDGDSMFAELQTSAAVCDGRVVGFIQYGIPCFIYNQQGEKDRSAKCGIIRHLYFDKSCACGAELISIAEQYFTDNAVEKRFAFFHAFGMTCAAGHGKLHISFEHIEKALSDAGYVREHENVYYRRFLTGEEAATDAVSLSFGERNSKGLQEFTVLADGHYVGAGAIVYLPQGGICYLKWIYIEAYEQRKGYASAALCQLFSSLYAQGIRRIDTDTADINCIAQQLYARTGFEDMGRTRSYLK